MQSIVVTGASSGIGKATAALLLEQGFRVFGTVRDAAAATALSDSYGTAFRPLVFDIRDREKAPSLRDEISRELDGENLFGLVNNAGIACLGPLAFQDLDELQDQLDVNLIAPIRLIQTLLPLMGGEAGRSGRAGRIVNVTSVSGRMALPFMGSYSASKHALEAASDALRRELHKFGIDVIVVEPGAIATPLWQKTSAGPDHPYKASPLGAEYLRFMQLFAERGARDSLPARTAAEVILKALTTERPRARYGVMKRPFQDFTLPRLLPDRWVDAIIRKQLR